MNMSAEEMKSRFMEFDKEMLCECLASILYQMNEKGIKFCGYQKRPEFLEYFDCDLKYKRIDGMKTPLEEMAQLNFYEFENEKRSSNKALIHFFEKEIEVAEQAKANGTMRINGVPCESLEQAKQLFDAHKKYCGLLIGMIEEGMFKE